MAALGEEAIQAAANLVSALQAKDSGKFKAAMDAIKPYEEGITQRDWEKMFSPALEKDPLGTMQFLQDNGVRVSRPSKATSLEPMQIYAGFRSGGLMYGPHFRTIRSSWSFARADNDRPPA